MHQKKALHQYSALALSFLFAGKEMEAQIVYTDIDPDIYWHGWDSNHIDILLDPDNDGISDFRIYTCSSSTEFYSCSGYAGAWFISAYRSNKVATGVLPVPTVSSINAACVSMCDEFYNLTQGVKPVLAGEEISGALHWGQQKLIFANHNLDYPKPKYGLFYPADDLDYFLPILVADYGTNFGWIRLRNENSNWAKTISDYGLNLVSDSAILAGDTSDLAESLTPGEANMYANGSTVYFSVSDFGQNNITIYDIKGAEVYTATFYSRMFECSLDVPRGIYIGKIQNENGVYCSKLFIE